MTLDDALLEVFRQTLIDDAASVKLNGETYTVQKTSRNNLRQIDFRFERRKLRGLEQNRNTASRWAQIARKGKPVMQFLENQRYFAVVADGKIVWYGKHEEKNAD